MTQYEAHYKVYVKGIHLGHSVHRLTRHRDGHYHYESLTQPRFEFIPYYFHETADFNWIKEKIVPKRFFYEYQEGKKHRRGFIRFDAEAKLISHPIGHAWEIDMMSKALDKLSYTLALRHDLIQGEKILNYQVVDEKGLQSYQFNILGNETLNTALGQLDTLKVQYAHPKYKTTFWLAKNLNFLLIKIQQERQGHIVAKATITEYQLL